MVVDPGGPHAHAAGMSDEPIGWIREIVLNSRDPMALAEFWARVVGGMPTEWYDGWVTLEPPPHGQRLSFQGSDDPGVGGVHVDVLVEDLLVAHEAVLAAGASYVEERVSPKPSPEGEPVPWRVYADPEGHLFCLVVR
jgi:Glyoxalase-like domain